MLDKKRVQTLCGLLAVVGALTVMAAKPADSPGKGPGKNGDGTQDPVPVYLETVQQVMDASRGDGDYANLPGGTTFVIRNGTYQTPTGLKVLMWIKKGGSAGTLRRFVGESRDGVVIVGRATVQADHVSLENMTFTLDGFEVDPTASFSTIAVVSAKDVRIFGLNCLGTKDKGKKGGHIETLRYGTAPVPEDVIIQDCLVEKFGRWDAPEGKFDHGIYIAAGNNIVVRDCEIRENSGRGIQLFVHENSADTITNVTIENNIIHNNGRVAYTDGIVVATGRTAQLGQLSQVVIKNNVFYQNAFSGIRLNTDFSQEVTVENNTFWRNSRAYDNGAEVVIDQDGKGRDTLFTRNIFVPKTVAVRGTQYGTNVEFKQNLVDGPPGSLDMTNNEAGENVLVDPENGDFRVSEKKYKKYGARVE